MTDTGRHGTVWSDEELDLLVAGYFAVLDEELAGRSPVYARNAERLMAATGRTHRSVEYKLMNLSAVLDALGLPIIRGYRPLPNIQRAIFGAVDRFLTAAPDRLYPQPPLIPAKAGTQAFSIPGWSEDAILFEALPPALTSQPPRPEPLERLVRKWDPTTRDFRNRALGEAGEHVVYRSEHARLRAADRADLARRVRWVAKEDGDGAGYDVLSFDADTGQERWLEVKTTVGGPTTPFFLTRNEKAVAEAEPDRFRLLRLYDFAAAPGAAPKLFTLAPPLDRAVTLEPETWRGRF